MNSKLSHAPKFITLCMTGIILIAGCTSLPKFNQKVYGSGNVVKETRVLQDFTEVVLSEEGDLFIEIGNQNELVIEAEDNLQKYLIPETGDNVLDIKKLPENITLNATKPIRYYLTVKELKSLTGKNSGNVSITEVDTDSFSVRITGSGSVHIGKLKTQRLAIELTSSGNLTVDSGEAGEQYVRLSSSGEYNGKNVACKTAYVELTSSGDATLNVLEDLTADLSSSGNVYYLGNPKVVYNDSSSTGRARSLP
jgi:hypothetical protein